MNIIISGINYKAAPLKIRERLSLSPQEQREALAAVKAIPRVKECVILSTCNRTEVYIHFDSKIAAQNKFDCMEIEKVLCEVKNEKLYELKKYFYTYSGVNAVRHLFQVASGLDSMILGEDQILGQVKSAHQASLKAGAGASVLNTLFRDAVTAAKEIKTRTELSQNSISVGSIAVKSVLQLCGGQLDNQCALVIGTGKIGSIVLKNLCANGIGKIIVTNRSHGKLEDLSKLHPNVHLVGYEQRYSVMDECDIVISSTSSPHYTITRDMLEKSLIARKERIFIDLAVPRDMDEEISGITGVRYFNMDQLETAADENLDKRMTEAVKAREMIHHYVMEFEKWYEFRKALPVVKDIQKYADELSREKAEKVIGKLKNASKEDKEAVKHCITNTVNEILNKFVYGVKENGSKDEIKAYFECLRDIVKENG